MKKIISTKVILSFVFFTLLTINYYLLTIFPAHAQQQIAVITPPPPGTTEWAFDAQTTEVGKRAERARQFVSFVLTHPSIDNHPVFRQVWVISAMTTLFLITISVAIMGLSVMVSKKKDVSFKIDIMPILSRVGMLLVYTFFSYWIVLGLIQISDLLMNFFMKLLNTDNLFTIFFAGTSDEGYKTFIGYRNMDPLVQESAKTSLFLLDLSSYSYFAIGLVLLLRKIILWFLLILAPLLALLLPFKTVRNAAWVWLGIFFHWALYGPVFGLFLGGLVKIWQAGIPFGFDFVKARTGEVVYPLAVNILYGGPAQTEGGLGAKLSGIEPLNSANYVDTFVEYVLSILMLWVVIVLPWFLIRTFQSYCCDGIASMKNVLLNMLDHMRNSPSASPTNVAQNVAQHVAQQMQQSVSEMSKQMSSISSKFEHFQDIKKVSSEEIVKKMDLSVSKLSDIARLETNSSTHSSASQNMQYLKNPLSAEKPQERADFVRVKTELTQRASSGDVKAQQVIAATTASPVVVRAKIQEMAKSRPNIVTISRFVADVSKINEITVNKVVKNLVQRVTGNTTTVKDIAVKAQLDELQTMNVLQAVPQVVLTNHSAEAVQKIAEKAGIEKEKTQQVLSEMKSKTMESGMVQSVATDEQLSVQQVQQVAQSVFTDSLSGPQAATSTQVLAPSPTLSIEEYEEIKKMWVEHYTNGEIPVTEKIKTRTDWVQADAVKMDNILNKLISDSEDVRAKGLEEVSDIIPFFMLGNMQIQDIATYLKAKQSAARDVERNVGREEDLKERLKAKSEDVVFVEKAKAKAQAQEQVMEMKMDGSK